MVRSAKNRIGGSFHVGEMAHLMVFSNHEKSLLILLGDCLDFIEIEPTLAVGLCVFGITDLVNTDNSHSLVCR